MSKQAEQKVTIEGGSRVGNITQNIIQNIFGNREEQRNQRNRNIMLKRVNDFWIKDVLEKSLFKAIFIELGIETRPDAIKGHPWDMILQIPKEHNRTLPLDTKIIDVFDEFGQTLLILGEPGSGKTTMLLELARCTIARAETNPSEPIPVILNLSSWANEHQSIADWVIFELNNKYNIPNTISCSWVENDELLLLLDGLDEVDLKLRKSCVQAINKFHQEHVVPVVICSRVAEYETIKIRLKLQNAVFLQPLTIQQVDNFLTEIGSETKTIRAAIHQDEHLQELVKSPLMLNIVVLAYREVTPKDLRKSVSVEQRRRYVFDTYIQKMFEHRRVDKAYSLEQTIHWLEWLARKMILNHQTIFFIERLQPYWLSKDKQQRLYSVGFKLFASFVGILIGFLFGGLIGGLIEEGITGWLFGGLVGGFVGGLNTGISAWLIGDRGSQSKKPIPILKSNPNSSTVYLSDVIRTLAGLDKGDIRTIESVDWSWKIIFQGLTQGIKYGAMLLVFFLSVWFVGTRIYGVNIRLPEGIVACLSCGLIFGLTRELMDGLTYSGSNIHITPNQGIRQSAKNAAMLVVIIGIVAGLSSGLNVWVSAGVVSGLVFFQSRWIFLEFSNLNNLFNQKIGKLATVLCAGLAFLFCFWILVGTNSNPLIRVLLGLLVGLLVGLSFGLEFGGLAVIQHFTLRYVLYRERHIPWNYSSFLDFATESIFLRKAGGAYIFIHRLLLEYFSTLNTVKNDDATAFYEKGTAHRNVHSFKEALANFDKAIQLDPNHVLAYFRRGELYYKSGDLKRAISEYDKAIEIDPKPAAIFYYNRGIVYNDLGDFESAIQDFSKALVAPSGSRVVAIDGKVVNENFDELSVDIPSVYRMRGTAYFNKKIYKKARADFTKVIKSTPDDAMDYYRRAIVYSHLRNYKLAIKDGTKAIKLNPKFAEAYCNRGLHFIALNNFDKALRDFNRAIELNPNLKYAYNGRGVLYKETGKIEQAFLDFNKALELDPKFASAYCERGDAYRIIGNLEEAFREFEKSITLDPNDEWVYFNRGRTYADSAKLEQAILDFNRAIEINANEAKFYRERAYAFKNFGDLRQAIIDFKRYLKVTSDLSDQEEITKLIEQLKIEIETGTV